MIGKAYFRYIVFLVAAASMLLPQSCIDGAMDNSLAMDSHFGSLHADALVTVKTSDSGKTYFQLDDSTTLEPVGWKNPFRTRTRALLRFSVLQEESLEFTRKVRVDWIDSVLTKNAVSYEEFGKALDPDPVELVHDWMTVCEDGFLTIHFATLWGDGKIPHKVTLVPVPKRPLEFVFDHDKNGDFGTNWSESVVAFRIEDFVPDTKGEEVNLTLQWKSFSGSQKRVFKYKTPER